MKLTESEFNPQDIADQCILADFGTLNDEWIAFGIRCYNEGISAASNKVYNVLKEVNDLKVTGR